MTQRSRWLALLTVAIVGFLAAALLRMPAQAPQSLPAPARDRPAVNPPAVNSPAAKLPPIPVPVAPSVAPSVDAERLLQHVRVLSVERSAALDRAQARNYLIQTLRQNGWKPEVRSFEGGANVVAHRAGSDDSAGTILVTAHYDTVPGSPGADDNASSVAATLELARLFIRSTPRSLRLAFFDQEEIGLRGSLAYTAQPENLTNLAGVVNLEMLGYTCTTPGCQKYPDLPLLPIAPLSDRGTFIGVVGDQEHLPLLAAFQSDDAALPPIVTLPIPLKGLLTPDVLRSDHAPFWAHNIGAVMVGDTANFRNPHYHQPSDTLETLDRAFLTGSTQHIINAVHRLLYSRNSLATPLAIPQ